MKINRQAVYDKYSGHYAYCGKSITIKSIKVTDFPPVNDAGGNWDTSAGPDIYPVVLYNNSELYSWENTPWVNAIPGETHTFYIGGGFNLNLDNLSDTYVIYLYDNDDFGGDENMNGISFTPNDFIKGTPDNFTLSVPSLNLEAVVTVEYTF